MYCFGCGETFYKHSCAAFYERSVSYFYLEREFEIEMGFTFFFLHLKKLASEKKNRIEFVLNLKTFDLQHVLYVDEKNGQF